MQHDNMKKGMEKRSEMNQGVRNSRDCFIRLFFFCFLSFLASSCSFLPLIQEKNEYIKVYGQHFVFNGKPYYFAGMNLWYACYLGSPGVTGDRPRLKRELDTMAFLGITNFRLLAASERSTIRRSIKPAIQISAARYDDSLLVGLDFTLDEMAKRHMHAVLYLTNYWEWSGEWHSIWCGRRERKEPILKIRKKGTGRSWDFSAKFYSMPDAVHLYWGFRHEWAPLVQLR